MSVKVETDGMAKAKKMLEGIPNGFEDAFRLSLNRAITSGRAVAVKETRSRYTVGAKDVRQTITLQRASKSNLDAGFVSRGARLKLSAYAHKPSEDTTGSNRKQVKVTMQKGQTFAVDKGFVYKKRIFARKYDTPYPVEMQFGRAVPRILDDDQIVDKVNQTMHETVEKRLEHETLRILEKKG